MKVNKIRGKISPNRELYKEIDGEKFYKTSISIQGDEIPIISSTYVLKDVNGLCDVDVVVKQEHNKSGYRFTYLYAIKVQKCEDQTLEDINSIHLGGRVISTFPPICVGSKCTELLKFKLVWNEGDSPDYINVRCMGKLARQLSAVKEGQVIDCDCYLKKTGDRLDFYIIKASYRDRIKHNKKKSE